MSKCLNPDCLTQNSLTTLKYCVKCGSKLLLKERYRAIRIIYMIAGLWHLNHQAANMFMTNFYNALAQPNVTNPEAFRQAQLSLIKDNQFNAPYYWASFVL